MNEKAVKIQEIPEMRDNPYSLAGWLAIVQAILFPLGFVVSIVQGAFGIKKVDFQGPAFGPSDIIFIVFTVFGIYVLLKFRQFLNERYNYHGIDTLILISIWWSILFQCGMFGLKMLFTMASPVENPTAAIVIVSFFALSMVSIGIVDIFIAVKLLKTKDTFSDLMKVFAYVTLVAGICELTVIFSPVSLVLVIVSFILIGMMLLRDEEGVQFV